MNLYNGDIVVDCVGVVFWVRDHPFNRVNHTLILIGTPSAETVIFCR